MLLNITFQEQKKPFRTYVCVCVFTYVMRHFIMSLNGKHCTLENRKFLF